MPVIPPTTWSDIEPRIRTGDIMLWFRRDDPGSTLIADVTGCPYSHVTMLVRPDPEGPPMLWQEATQSPAPDPIDKNRPHSGAQYGNCLDVMNVMSSDEYKMTPYYRPLDLNRTQEFEDRVQEIVKQLDGIPFPPYWEMVVDAALGREGFNTGISTMFCSQLVAKTMQLAGLLEIEHPANWYTQASFSSYTDDCTFLLGAQWGAIEQEVSVPLT